MIKFLLNNLLVTSSIKVILHDCLKIVCLFNPFTQDGDGTVSTKELGAVMRSIGLYPTEEELEEMIDVMSSNAIGVFGKDFFDSGSRQR